MAVGKNKKLNKGKKGNKKRNYDIFSKKEWCDVKCPTYFNKTKSKIGYAVVSKSQGLKLAKDGLVGRVYDVCLDDLKEDESAHRKVKLIAEDVRNATSSPTSTAWTSPQTNCAASSRSGSR